MPREERKDEGNDDRMRVGRRGFIALTGAALATGAGIASNHVETSVPAVVQPMELYGYGGTPIRTTESISTTSSVTATQLATTTEVEPNDDRTEASNVGVDVEVTGSLDPAEVDWYAFDLAEGQQVTATLDRDRNRGVTAFIIYGPDGRYRDMIYLGNGKPGTLAVDGASQAGTYYAEVVDIQSGDGAYVLTIESGETDGTGSDGTQDNSTDDSTDDPVLDDGTDDSTDDPNDTTDDTTNDTSDNTTNDTSDNTTNDTSDNTTNDTSDNTTVIDDTTVEFGTQGYGELGYGGIAA